MAASFRFGGLTTAGPRQATIEFARTAEAVGLDTVLMADHLTEMADAPTSLMFMADHTERVRVGTYVMCADFRHPVVLARSLANIDELSGGRLEVGLGAGYLRLEYDAAGIPLASGAVRLARVQETTTIVKAMLAASPIDFNGSHFTLAGQVAFPLARQRPHPPFLIGGGGPKLLSWAATEADIVSFVPQSAAGGNLRVSTMTGSAVDERVALVRRAAGQRADALELNTLLWHLDITTDRRGAAERWLDSVRNQSAPYTRAFTFDSDVTADDILDSPYVAFGTVEDVVEHFRGIRARTGISYWALMPHHIKAFVPVLEALKAG